MLAIRVLLVNGERLVLEGLAQLLQRYAEFQVVALASNGVTALDELASHRPHVVVIDLSSPGTSSLETIRRMRRGHPFVKVVIVASNQHSVCVQEEAAAPGPVP